MGCIVREKMKSGKVIFESYYSSCRSGSGFGFSRQQAKIFVSPETAERFTKKHRKDDREYKYENVY
jgi:hypothetical protein